MGFRCRVQDWMFSLFLLNRSQVVSVLFIDDLGFLNKTEIPKGWYYIWHGYNYNLALHFFYFNLKNFLVILKKNLHYFQKFLPQSITFESPTSWPIPYHKTAFINQFYYSSLKMYIHQPLSKRTESNIKETLKIILPKNNVISLCTFMQITFFDR